MALETGTYVSDLVPSNPVASDGLSQTDDHLRLIKAVLKNTFPNITGALTETHAKVNGFDSRISVLEAAQAAGMPVGTVILWYGTSATVPTDWHICDGTNGTPDLRGKFVKGCDIDAHLGNTGGDANPITTEDPGHNHTGFCGYHQLTIGEMPVHDHELRAGIRQIDGDNSEGDASVKTNFALAPGYIGSAGGDQAHRHSISSDGTHTHSVSVDPVHAQLYYIMKIV